MGFSEIMLKNDTSLTFFIHKGNRGFLITFEQPNQD